MKHYFTENRIPSNDNDLSKFEFQGSLHDEGSLIEAIKQVNVVICAVNSKQVLDQKPLISAIKKAGCIEVVLLLKFLPVFHLKVPFVT